MAGVSRNTPRGSFGYAGPSREPRRAPSHRSPPGQHSPDPRLTFPKPLDNVPAAIHGNPSGTRVSADSNPSF
ncbi:protein of unknown function [Denitratisoma oestradiolicum]|uniref:Uncharacterized protein n=1 Tax=Denitratisoma oestradiolicum TaxID=311182 RepID=A0A6S6Y371_9PROT|nr:protein of unknown function [Denitratisoma oestradiolicum]